MLMLGFCSFPHVAYSSVGVAQSVMITQADNCSVHICLKGEAHGAVSVHYGGFDMVREGFPEKVMLKLSADE